MSNDLKKHLENNPQLSHVYFNDNNEWQFHKRAGYDKVLTRDEVLDMDIPEDEPIEDENEVVVKPKAEPKAKAKPKAPAKPKGQPKAKVAEIISENKTEDVNKVIE